MDHRLKKFFEPRSVAIIGASSTPHKPGNDVILNILANGFQGDVYLVNPKGGQILGKKVYASPSELPAGIDLGIIILPASANPGVIRECGARGMEALILVAGGFAEAGEAGAGLQEETIHAVLCVLMLTDETGVPPLDFLVELAARYREKPIYVTCSGQKKHMVAAKAFLEPRGVPTFWFAEEALEVLSLLAERREVLER